MYANANLVLTFADNLFCRRDFFDHVKFIGRLYSQFAAFIVRPRTRATFRTVYNNAQFMQIIYARCPCALLTFLLFVKY